MNSKIVTFLTLAIFGFAVCQAHFGTIKLHVFPSSSTYWVAVAPLNDWGKTKTIEAQEGGNASAWVEMIPNAHWGYWMLPSNGTEFELPLSLRLTSRWGSQIELPNILTTISGSEIIDTGATYSGHGHHHGSGSADSESNEASGSTEASESGEASTEPTEPSESESPEPVESSESESAEPVESESESPEPVESESEAPEPVESSEPADSESLAEPSSSEEAPTEVRLGESDAHGHGGNTTKPTTAPTTKPTTAPTTKPTTSPTTKPTTAPSGGSTDLCGVTPLSSEPLKLLVPLYVYPGSSWTELVTAAQSGVEVIAIINPNSGPDSSGPDSTYTSYMTQLKNAGVQMVGYVHTSYGSRALSDVENDVSVYASKYSGLSGIFVDETSADAGEVSYYTSLFNSIKSHSGFTQTILNPGAQPDQGYLNAGTSIVVFEDSASNFRGSFSSWVTCAPNAASKAGYKYKFGAIAYGASSGSVSSIISQMSNAGMGLVYVTDGASGCCTYNTLASYFTSEAAAVKSLNG